MTRQILHILIICLLLAIILTTGCIASGQLTPVPGDHAADMQKALDSWIPVLDSQITEICALTSAAAVELKGTENDPFAQKQIFLQLRRDIPACSEICLADAHNIVAAVTGNPKNQEYIGHPACTAVTEEEFAAAGGCIISPPLTLINGDLGILFSAPVYDKNGIYAGSLRVFVNPAHLFSGPVSELKKDGYTLWTVRPDGVQIYDEDLQELSKNILTDILYQESTVYQAMHRVTSEKQGAVSYLFHNVGWTGYGQANAVWNTIGLPDGTEWRVVLSDNVNTEKTAEPAVSHTADDLRTFVEKAYRYARTHTKEDALAAFNDPNGAFVDKELYIFAYDMYGSTLALPYQPDMIGMDRRSGEDIVGVKPVQRFIDRAGFGGGYLFYQYPNPANGFASELKLSYVMSVDDDWLIGAGIYPGTPELNYSWEMRDQLIMQVRELHYLSTALPREELLRMMNDPSARFHVEGLYPFALDAEGTLLSNAYNPSRIGTNHLGYTNSFGMSPIREALSLCASGGGLMYSLVLDPAYTREEYILMYVEPADDGICYGSMMVLE